jgi:hypothetical protein
MKNKKNYIALYFHACDVGIIWEYKKRPAKILEYSQE